MKFTKKKFCLGVQLHHEGTACLTVEERKTQETRLGKLLQRLWRST
jgi:hypothetical protein